MSILGVYFGWIKLILDYRKREVLWRDRIYVL